MRRVMVLGGAGMLGHKLVQSLGPRFDLRCTLRETADDPLVRACPLLRGTHVIHGVDAMDWEALAGLLRAERPDVVVNCVGVIKQRPGAAEHIPSIALNALLPHRLAALTAGWGGRLIHFSTDCVFSGETGRYTEASPPDARDLYGRSKFLGEVATDNALTLRTSIIGRELKHFASLLEWFLARRGGTVGGYRRVLYSGVTTGFMARLVGDLIADHPDLSGLWQVTGATIAKHDLLVLVKEAFGLDVTIEAEDETVSDRSMIGAPFVAATGLATPAWPELVAELAADPTPYDDWRVES